MTTPLRCIGEPVSWLRLERYHLGELDASQRASIEAHLAACPACAACLSQIEKDEGTPLPSLELSGGSGTTGGGGAASERGRGVLLRFPGNRARIGSIVGALAVAAAALLGVGRGWRHSATDGALVAGSPSVKGGEVVLTLVREDGVRIEDGASETALYRDGDRFKVLVTCPPTLHTTFDVTVTDDGGTSFPLARVQSLDCGNEVPLRGAFRVTGSGDEKVCLVWSAPGAPGQTAATAPGATGLSTCKTLRAARAP